MSQTTNPPKVDQGTGGTSAWKVDGSTATQPVSAASLPLPTGASTSAKQDTGNTSVASIDGKVPALGQALAAASTPVVLTAAQVTTLTPPAAITGFATEVTLDARTGVLTEAAPATDTASSGLNGRLQRIAQRLTSLIALLPGSIGQKAKAASLAVTLASDQDALPITDNAGSLTVDAPVGTPVFVRLSDGAAAITTLPVSAASLPLATGAATEAKQDTGNTSLGSIDTKTPALGQALAAASTPVVLTAAQVTTLTPPAAITNFANETGGNLAAATTALQIMDDWDEVDRAKVNPIVGQAGVAAGAGVVGLTVQRTTLASDDPAVVALQILDNAIAGNEMQVDVVAPLPAGTNNIGDVDVLTVPAPLSTTGGGTQATALRVTVASDSTGVLAVTDNSGSLTVDAPVATPVFVRLSDGAAAISTLPISAASLPLPTGAALDATLTGGTAKTRITNGTVDAGVEPFAALQVNAGYQTLFYDSWSGALDTADKWAVSGTVPTIANGNMQMSAELSSYNAIRTKDIIRANVGFTLVRNGIQLEAAAATGAGRFWGLGTVATAPSATSLVQDGVGFEIDQATGGLLAVTYVAGVRTTVASLTRPSDGATHPYACYFRVTYAYWQVDGATVASQSFPNVQGVELPALIVRQNGASFTGTPVFTSIAHLSADTSKSSTVIGDPVVGMRQARVTADGALKVSGTLESANIASILQHLQARDAEFQRAILTELRVMNAVLQSGLSVREDLDRMRDDFYYNSAIN